MTPPETSKDAPAEILFVDDDYEDYQLTEAMLKSQQNGRFKLDWSESFDAGIERLTQSPPDACLVDYHLGGFTGLDFVREANARGYTGPIIILTGRQDDDLDQQALDAGAVDYLEKNSVNANLLGRAIRYAIHRKRLEAELLRLASYDALTGVRNRSSFDVELTRVLNAGRRHKEPAGLFLFDIDHFKRINDSMGHRAGDAVLKEVAARLQHKSRVIDILSRWGGDEFAIIAENVGTVSDAERLAQRIVDCLAEPIVFEGATIHASLSVGAVYCEPGTTDHDILLQRADEALYIAKSGGRNRFAFYDREMNLDAERRRVIHDHLHAALDTGAVTFAGQPIVACRGGSIAGIELLARLSSPETAGVPTENLIRVADEGNLIWSLTRAAFLDAGKWFRTHLQDDNPGARVAINLSPRQVRRADTTRTLIQLLKEADIPASWIELEIPESGIAQDPIQGRRLLSELRQAGFALCLDGFTATRLSLLHLVELPFDRIKLDRSLCDGACEEGPVRLICEHLAAVCHSLQIRLTAYPMESEAQTALFRQLGFDLMQGHEIAPPRSITAFQTD